MWKTALILVLLAGISHPGAGGLKQDESVLFATTAFIAKEERQAPAAIVLGGTIFTYEDMDWTMSQDSLVDAMNETMVAMFWAPNREIRRELARGYMKLLAAPRTPEAREAHWAFLMSINHTQTFI